MRREILAPAVAGLTLLSALALTPPAAAQERVIYGREPIKELRLEVVDARTGSRLDEQALCQGLDLEHGQQVELRLVGLREQGDQGIYLPTRFSTLSGQQAIALSDADEARGAVDVRGLEGSDERRTTVLVYELADYLNLSQDLYRQGGISIAVAAPKRAVTPQPLPTSRQVTSAEELVARLYRGILLRDPEAAVVAQRAADIRQRPLEHARRQAVEIAESPESVSEVGRRAGVTAEKRLDALYRELVELTRDNVDSTTWQRHLSMIERGQIASVVDELVRSQRFTDVHLFGPQRYLLRRNG